MTWIFRGGRFLRKRHKRSPLASGRPGVGGRLREMITSWRADGDGKHGRAAGRCGLQRSGVGATADEDPSV